MPRPQRPLDPQAGPASAFAAELRKLHESAGSPTFLKMARKSGKSRTALSEAAGGDHLPTWETVAAFVTACGASPTDWRVRWEQTREDLRTGGSRAEPTTSDSADDTPALMPPKQPNSRYLLPALVGAVVFGAVAYAVFSGDRVAPPASGPSSSTVTQAIITVQNKVAVGASDLIEDKTPAYLTSRLTYHCPEKNCKIEGTDMASGARLVADCYLHGRETFNYNLDSTEAKNNPHRARSTLWYRVLLPDGRSGYIAEIYIAAEDRGGKGLPVCATPRPS